ncbi:MAG: signal peptidase II [Gemmataceae bacterium]
MLQRRFYGLWLTLALFAFVADQATKYSVFGWLATIESNTFALFQTEPERRTFAIVPMPVDPRDRLTQRGFFLEVAFEPRREADAPLVPHVNQGALFGLGREHAGLANGVFAGISLFAATGICFWAVAAGGLRDRWLTAALGLILGGCLGNLYDRLVFNGVRDFLHWNYLFDWPVFNVADCCLVIGAAMLLLQAFFAPQSDKEKAPTDSAPHHQPQQRSTGSIVPSRSTV